MPPTDGIGMHGKGQGNTDKFLNIKVTDSETKECTFALLYLCLSLRNILITDKYVR